MYALKKRSEVLSEIEILKNQMGKCGLKNVERFTILRVILAQGPC
jgi:hypothetical protein